MNTNDSTKLRVCAFSLGAAVGIVEGVYMMRYLHGQDCFGGMASSLHPSINGSNVLPLGYAPTSGSAGCTAGYGGLRMVLFSACWWG